MNVSCRPVELSIPEGKDPSVGGEEPVPLTVWRRRYADDWFVEVLPSHGPIELGVSEGEDSSVRPRQPVAVTASCLGDHPIRS